MHMEFGFKFLEVLQSLDYHSLLLAQIPAAMVESQSYFWRQIIVCLKLWLCSIWMWNLWEIILRSLHETAIILLWVMYIHVLPVCHRLFRQVDKTDLLPFSRWSRAFNCVTWSSSFASITLSISKGKRPRTACQAQNNTLFSMLSPHRIHHRPISR